MVSSSVIVVPMHTTPLDIDSAVSGFITAYEQTFGFPPSKNTAKALLSLVWIETASGRKVQNHNWGNISASPNYPGKVWRPPWFEPSPEASTRLVSLHEQMKEGRAPQAFRAYDSHSEGAADYLRQLRHSFPEVLEAAELDDPDSFRDALSRKYSPDYANPASTATFQQFFAEFEPRLPMLATSSNSIALSGGRSVGMTLLGIGLLGATGFGIWYAYFRKVKNGRKSSTVGRSE